MTFLPTSAKTTTNVSEAFITLTKTLIDTTYEHEPVRTLVETTDGVHK